MQRYYFLLENMYRAMMIFWLTCLVGYPRTSAPEPFKKLVISIIFSIFVVENQYIINKEYYHYGDYQRQNYRNFLYYR